ncbi:ATP-binding protein [Tropicimonas sp. IMCC34043]|uniref:ATP-binding protein n=1 Tax=Tropicimonas sp. IMCC34043 TaxID=2248760 RepID=UPI000E273188|nr:ATP-binding protein [Tropicimonas sp. IMCC34043]
MTALGHSAALRLPSPGDDAAFVGSALSWVRALLTGVGVEPARLALDAARQGSPLDRLSRCLALAPADEDLLILALTHRIDGAVAALCAEASGDPRQGYVTGHLLTQLVGDGDPAFAAAVFARLVPEAPLRRWRLVEMRESHALSAVTLTEDVALRLAGLAPGGPPRGCRALPSVPALARFQHQAEALAPWLARGLALIGPAGSGRRALAAALARQAGMAAVLIDPGRLPEGPGRFERLQEIAREARLDRLVAVIDADPDTAARSHAAAEEGAFLAHAGTAGRGLAAKAAAAFEGNLVVLARDPTDLPAGLHRERIAPLGTADRITLWRTALGERRCASEAAEVGRHFPLGPSEIAEIAAGIGPDEPPGTLWQRCRGRGGQGLEALATRIVPRFGWDDLIVADAVREDLRTIADQLRHRQTVYDGWGFGRRLSGAGRGITALFAGPSGVGKTMAAEVIAGELGLDLYKVDLSRLVSKYIGETEKNLRRVFDAAEETGACLFLDEADACLGKRSEVKDSHDRHANIEVSYLLQRIEGYAGLCLLATNLKNNIDTAFLRRIRFVIDMPFPDQGQRYRIWQGAFPQGTPTEGLDLAALSRLDISGGSILVIAVNAAFLAAAEAAPVTMERIGRAARAEFRKHDRSFRPVWTEARP